MSVQNVLRKILNPVINNQYRVRHLCNAISSGKDFKQTSQPDLLMNNIKHATSTKNILNTVNQHERVMNAKHIMQALRSLFVLQKEGRSELSTKEILNHKEFGKLCRRLKFLSGVIDINETIEAFKIVTYVGVPKDSIIVNVLLQLIRHNLNEMSLSNVMFMEFLLGHYPNVPLAEALKIALPIVFEIQLPVKMDRTSITSLREYLFFAARNKLSDKTIDLIVSSMLTCKDMSDSKTAKSIVWSLTELPPSPTFEHLMKQNIEMLVVHLDELSYDDLDTTLSKLSTAYRREYPFFRSKLFCDAVVGYVIDNNLNLKNSIYTMKKLDRLGITNKYLVDYVSKKIEEIDSIALEDNLYSLYVLLKYLSKTDYRPPNWDSIERMLENMEITKEGGINWLKFGASLSYHQIFNESVLMKSFRGDLEHSLQRRKSFIYLFLMLYHSIKLYRPQLMKLVPRQIRPKDLIQYLTIPDELPLQGALYNAFGGEKYVKSGFYSKEGIFIDHAIVFRKGGYPVATNSKSIFIEDLDVQSENQIVVVVSLPPELYTEENYLKIGPSTALKVLEDLGYITVPVCLSSWYTLADYEKIPYLVQNIKNKLGEDMMLQNNCA